MWQCVFVFPPLMVAYNASREARRGPLGGFSAIMAVVMLLGFAGFARSPEAHGVRSRSTSYIFGRR